MPSPLTGAIAVLAATVTLTLPILGPHDFPERGRGRTELTMPDGRSTAATRVGDMYLVDRSVDPDGFVLRADPDDDIDVTAVPSCVEIVADPSGVISNSVRAVNHCLPPVGVTFVIAFSLDSECLIVPPGEQATYTYYTLGLARFDGARSCR